MSDRLTKEERRVVASLMEMYGSPIKIRRKFAKRFQRDPSRRLTIYRIYEKFVKTGSIENNYKGNAGRSRTGRSDKNIAAVHQSIVKNPGNSTTRCSLETEILRKLFGEF